MNWLRSRTCVSEASSCCCCVRSLCTPVHPRFVSACHSPFEVPLDCASRPAGWLPSVRLDGYQCASIREGTIEEAAADLARALPRQFQTALLSRDLTSC